MADPHTLIVAAPGGTDSRYEVECPGSAGGCGMWQQCNTCPADFEATDPATGEMIEATEQAHGVEHRWIDSEWRVPTAGCFIATHPDLSAAAQDLELPPGRHVVEIDWSEAWDDCYALCLRVVVGTRDGEGR